MKKLLFIAGIILFTSCEKDEIIQEFEEQIEQPVQTRIFTLHKNSYLNQKSGITWIWGNRDSQPTTTPMPSYFSGGQSYIDINSDGLMDVLLSSHADNNDALGTHFYLNNGTGQFIKTDKYLNQSTNGLSSHKILKTDINHDKYADFILLGVDETEPGNYGGNFSSLVSDVNGNYNVVRIAEGKGGYYYHTGAAGDLNGDGEVDVITATFIWYGDGTGNFVKQDGITMNDYINAPLSYEIMDINKDGMNDIILATKTRHDKTTIILNKNGRFDTSNQLIKLEKISDFEETMDLELYDIDEDGDLDVIECRQKSWGDQGIPENFTSELFVYLNDNLNFKYTPNYIQNSDDGNYVNGTSDKFGWSTFKFDDIDNDGKDEIVAENYHDGKYIGLKKINNKWEKFSFKF